ncbi:hypothetical protein SAMN05444481_13623 [Flavobacterium frigidimaris]|nr:hypothetical protein SAMN05444481_13623 [Flavobacterium frigidimaris]
MLNINLKIETKNSYVIDNKFITFSDMPRSEEIKLYYQIFEDCFLEKYLRKKESKKLKRKVILNSYKNERQNELSLKISKLCNSQIYINKKISLLKNPFPSEDVYIKRLKLEAQTERISAIIESMKDELFSIYFK